MKSVRWRRQLRLNKAMLHHELEKRKATTNLQTHKLRGMYSISSQSVEVSVLRKDQLYQNDYL